MQMCQNHWDMLRQEVERQGLSQLISGSAEVAVCKSLNDMKQEEETKENFDPLMRCWFMIVARTLDIAGLTALTGDFGCPICMFNSLRTPEGACGCGIPDCQLKEPGSVPDHEGWIVGDFSCVTAVRNMCLERGWIE